MSYDVVTIGSATVDQFADTDSELIRIETPRTQETLIAFPVGSKILVRSLDLSVGGGGTNTAVAFARLGFRTAYLGKIGEDGNGDFVIQSLAKEGIDFIGSRGGTTGISVIMNSLSHDRTILAFKGCNNDLQPEDIPAFSTRWIYLSSMLGQSFDSISEMLAKCDYPVAFNPSNYQAELGYESMLPLLSKVAVLIMNREEACKFLGISDHTQVDPQFLFKEMLKLPPKIFVITDGAEGVHVFDREYYYRAWSREDIEIAETTGAGDAFAATFSACYFSDLGVEKSIHFAMTNAESVIQHRGAKEILLSWQELDAAANGITRRTEKQTLHAAS